MILCDKAPMLRFVLACALLAGCGQALNGPFQSGQRLRARVLDGGQGAVSLQGWFDAELGTACEFHVATDGRLRCLPTSAEGRIGWTETDVLYDDAACSHPLTAVALDAPAPAMVLGEPGAGTSCDSDDRPFPVHQRGAPRTDVAVMYYRYDGACEASSSDPATAQLFGLGEAVDPTAFVRADISVEVVDARISASVRRADDRSYEIVGLVDRARDAECVTLWTALPSSCYPARMAWDVGYHADAACTEPVAYTSPFVPNGGEDECPPLVVMAYGEDCGAPVTRAIGERTDAVATEWGDGECLPLDQPDDPHAYYEVGAPIPLDEWPQIEPIEGGTGPLRVREGGVNGQALQQDWPAFADTTWGEPCSPALFCDGTTRCLPSYAWADTFADAACTERIIRVGASCGVPSDDQLALKPSTAVDGCIAEGDVVRVGDPVTPAEVWYGDGVNCVPYGEFDPTLWRAAGDAVATTAFAELIRRTE